MAKKRNPRPFSGENLRDPDDGSELCDEIADLCEWLQEKYEDDLDEFQESTLGKAADFATKIKISIEERGVFTENQEVALNRWKDGVKRVEKQLEG
jgi:hypothetical protein